MAEGANAPSSAVEQLTETIYECFFDTLTGLHQLAQRTVPPGTRGAGLYGVRHEPKGQTFYFTEEEINKAYRVDGDGAKLERELKQRLKKEGWPEDATQAARYDIVYAQHLGVQKKYIRDWKNGNNVVIFAMLKPISCQKPR